MSSSTASNTNAAIAACSAICLSPARLDAYANTAVKRGNYSKQIEPGDPAPEPPPSPLAMRKFKEKD